MGNNEKSLLIHFRPEERPFVDRVLEWLEKASDQHTVKLTDFLDPRQQQIVSSLVGKFPNVRLAMSGGYPDAERKRAMIGPDYLYVDDNEFSLQLLSVTSPDPKFSQLDHGDFLGAILGLGLKRDKIGDLQIHPHACQYVVAAETASFLDMNLNQIHRVSVLTELLPIDRLEVIPVRMDEMTISVASLRLDGIVSDVVRLSRSKIMIPIKAGKCKVNWKVEENPSALLQEGDVVSLKGFGRFKVLEILGESKSGRTRVKIGKYA
ncbi:RNA-binding protein [Marinicrinis lubricantis]|uniref:RNA-binding protein n=1 Tax=Marinicrinis lubricantis TaxID=2086470 RepID=A0ABW1ISE5_9BACL